MSQCSDATPHWIWLARFALFAVLLLPWRAHSQDNYEIQVYGSETVPPGDTMVELHSNYTISGEREPVNGVLPSYHALHETLEITHGFTSWFETGFYIFTSVQPGRGWEWVGDHIRPRVRVPHAVEQVGHQQAAEEHHFGGEEDPHAEGRCLGLLLHRLEMMLVRRMMDVHVPVRVGVCGHGVRQL